jgi:hypothetical protein
VFENRRRKETRGEHKSDVVVLIGLVANTVIQVTYCKIKGSPHLLVLFNPLPKVVQRLVLEHALIVGTVAHLVPVVL